MRFREVQVVGREVWSRDSMRVRPARRIAEMPTFGGLRGSPFTSLWWQMESFTSLWGHTWIGVYMPLVPYVDRRLQALDGLR